jgi:hypothetical protein
MPLPSGVVIKVVWAGPVTQSDDWSFGVWYTASGVPSQSDLDTQTSDGLASMENTFWNASSNPWKGKVTDVCKLTDSKSYVYNGGTLVAQSAATISGVAGTGVQNNPPYVAAVMSLHTSGFGRRRRGRIYLPANGISCDSATGLMGTLVQDHVDHMRTVIAAWGDTGAPFAATPVVVSQTGGFSTPITSISLDNKPDTQRGRQNRDTASQNLTATL